MPVSGNNPGGTNTGQSQNTVMQSAMHAAQERGGGQSNQGNQSMNNQSNRGGQGPQVSFRNLGSLIPSPIGRTPASEALSKMKKAIDTLLSESMQQNDYEVRTLAIDYNNTSNLAVSVIVICSREKGNAQGPVAFHTLLIEASAPAPEPTYMPINGQQVEIHHDIGEANDGVLMQAVSQVVEQHYPGVIQFPVDAQKIPRSFDSTDGAAMQRMLANAVYATIQELQTRHPGFEDLNLAQIAKDSNLNLRVSFDNPQTLNEVGEPIRTDVQVEFTAAPLQQNNQGGMQQNVERTSAISVVGGFVDAVWAPVTQQMQTWGQAPMQNFQRYAARFVITRLESATILTPSMLLLVLVTGMAVAQNNLWVNHFRPRARSKDDNSVDIRDIGAVGYEVNFESDPRGFGKPVDTKADNFTTKDFYDLVQSTFRENMILSMDVPECGPNTWSLNIFSAVAAGDSAAEAALLEAANTLTNKEFGKMFDASQGPIIVDEVNRIHLGYYVNRHGERRDIRDFDYLAVANREGDKHPEIIQDFSDTFTKTQEHPLPVRMAGRARILMNLSGDTMVITGYARRLTFAPHFLVPLVAGCEKSGLAPRINATNNDIGNYARGVASVTNMMLGSNVTNMFNRGANYMPNVGVQQRYMPNVGIGRQW